MHVALFTTENKSKQRAKHGQYQVPEYVADIGVPRNLATAKQMARRKLTKAPQNLRFLPRLRQFAHIDAPRAAPYASGTC